MRILNPIAKKAEDMITYNTCENEFYFHLAYFDSPFNLSSYYL